MQQLMAHDFQKQYQETLRVWVDLNQRLDLPDKINLDLQLIPNSPAADKSRLKVELEKAGYLVRFYEHDETVEAYINNIETDIDTIWLHEKRTSEIALSNGYEPDGWGFLDPSTSLK